MTNPAVGAKKTTHEKIIIGGTLSAFIYSYLNNNFNSNIYVEGHFESEKYFLNYRSDLLNEFSFSKNIKCIDNYLDSIINSNSISFAMRRDRFTESFDDDKNSVKLKKTFDSEKAQFDFIVNSINYFKERVTNPKFFLFSDNFAHVFSWITWNFGEVNCSG